MELYPNFVQELNTLLKPEHHIVLPSPNELTTEVRIYALMRLGVTDSQEIATLLYYSTQTIYNYKSGMRAKALNREASSRISTDSATLYKELKELSPLTPLTPQY